MKHTSIFFTLILAGLLGATASCSSSSGNATPPASIPAPVSGFASASAVTSSLTASLGSIGGGGSALVKGQSTDEWIGGCINSEDYTVTTCECPGGGFNTDALEFTSFTLSTECPDDGATFTGVIVKIFTDCVVEKCGETITLNGITGGYLEGSLDCNGTLDATSDVSTIDEEANPLSCSGITVSVEGNDDVNVGLSTDYTIVASISDGTILEESFSGSFCTDPPGEPDGVIEFTSFDELEASADPDGECAAGCEETCQAECASAGGDEITCEEDCALECE